MKSLSPTAFKKLKFDPGVIFIDETSILPNDELLEKKLSHLRHLLDQSTIPYHVVLFEEVSFSFILALGAEGNGGSRSRR